PAASAGIATIVAASGAADTNRCFPSVFIVSSHGDYCYSSTIERFSRFSSQRKAQVGSFCNRLQT
ncbi:MAG: hypothetical protein AAFQ33_14745, partial [Pseudomonadota bacterium]